MRIASMAALGLALTGCIYVDGGSHSTESDEMTFDDAIGEVSFDLAAGDLEVTTGDVVQTTLVRNWSYKGDRPDVTAAVQGDTLILEVDCNNFMGNCWVDHQLVVPAGVDVWGSTGSGDVIVDQTGGFLDVETGSGDVFGSGLGAEGARVETGSGDVALDFSDKPEFVGIDTGSGDVRLDVPGGTYDVDIDTGSGDVLVDGIQTSNGANKQIRIDTGSGDVSVRGF